MRLANGPNSEDKIPYILAQSQGVAYILEENSLFVILDQKACSLVCRLGIKCENWIKKDNHETGLRLEGHH